DTAVEFSIDIPTEFDGSITIEEQLKFLNEKFKCTKAGEIDINIEDRKAHFKWILPIVVQEAEELHKEALAHAKKKDYSTATTLWVKAISLNPVDPDYYFNTGIAFFEQNNYREAIDNLDYALQLCPIYYKARLILGTVYLKLRKFDHAEKHLLESIAFNHENTLALLNLATASSVLKKYDTGISIFKKITEINPLEVRAFFGMAKIYSLQNKIQDANECYHKVVEIDPKGPLAAHAKRLIVADRSATQELKTNPDIISMSDYQNLDDIFSEAYSAYLFSDYKFSADLYKKYVNTKSDDEQAWYSLGEANLRCGHLETALSAFQKAIKLNPTKALYFKQTALCYDLLNRNIDALNAIKKAHDKGKSDSTTLMLYGKILIANNDLTKATELLLQAVKRNKQNISAEFYLAHAYWKQGLKEQATEHLYWVLNSKVNTPLKADAERLLSEIKST
ncbi:tetratricopeptide repeat protein, partial [candidate division KSB1 bacterium]|nr:tetratricopeptide repeat protein [candidate division KSB1 bacterium]